MVFFTHGEWVFACETSDSYIYHDLCRHKRHHKIDRQLFQMFGSIYCNGCGKKAERPKIIAELFRISRKVNHNGTIRKIR
jgi:hypothetical protein